MGKTNKKAYATSVLALSLITGAACTHKVQIEPSDKPFVVNLNVKIDHDIRVQIEDQNKDLINLEDAVLNKTKKES